MPNIHSFLLFWNFILKLRDRFCFLLFQLSSSVFLPSVLSSSDITDDVNFNPTATKSMLHNNLILRLHFMMMHCIVDV